MFDLETLNRQLAEADCIAANRVRWYDEVSSTSDIISSLDDYHGAVCLAGLQTAGRGRRGQPWTAPSGSSVLMSLGWQLDSANAAGLSLVCGLGIRHALKSLGVSGVNVKWPNDVLINQSKLCGILVELNGRRCVIGIGLNIRLEPGAMQYPGTTRTPWTDLYNSGHNPDPTLLVSTLINSVCRQLSRFNRHGFDDFRQDWDDAHGFQGKQVEVRGESESKQGIVTGVDATGGLVLETTGGRQVFYAGEVSMLPLPTRVTRPAETET